MAVVYQCWCNYSPMSIHARISLCDKLHAHVVAIRYARRVCPWVGREHPGQVGCACRLSAHLDCQKSAWEAFRVLMLHMSHNVCLASWIMMPALTKHTSMSLRKTPTFRALGCVYLFSREAAVHVISTDVWFICAVYRFWLSSVILRRCAAASKLLYLLLMLTDDLHWLCLIWWL